MDTELLLSSLEQFHFIRPLWLWGLPLAVLLWLLLRNQLGDQQWSSHISKEMLAALKVTTATQSTRWKWLLLLLCLSMITAAAGPTWDKQAAPTVQNQKALVLVLDLSPSMLAQDMSPDRLTRAKYKLIDVLRQQADGQAALIAYAGDAHTVSPLTDDPRTIEALLPALHPNVMPSRGSNTEAAIQLAQTLLSDAGLFSGDILLISDGVADDAIKSIDGSINPNYRLSVLAIGGNEAAPIPAANGGFIRKANGEIVLSKVNSGALRSMASSLGGHFSMISADDSDIRRLKIGSFETTSTKETKESSVVYDAWVDMGHWLVLIMLPLALFLFRKGALYIVPLCLPLLMLAPNESYAADFSWKDLWETRDQQARQQFEKGDFEAAANTFQREDWSAIANYKNGSYDETIKQLTGLGDATSLYNKGNALAFNGQLQEALEAYDSALKIDPSLEDAAHNKSVVEELIQQQEQSSEKSQEENSNDSESQDSESQDSESQDSESQDSESQDSESQDSESQDSESQESESQDSESQESEDDKADEEQNKNSEAENPETDEEEQSPEMIEAPVSADNTEQPLKDSSEQWLRTIQDDPSGLLRRKFNYQAQQRAKQNQRRSNGNATQERY